MTELAEVGASAEAVLATALPEQSGAFRAFAEQVRRSSEPFTRSYALVRLSGDEARCSAVLEQSERAIMASTCMYLCGAECTVAIVWGTSTCTRPRSKEQSSIMPMGALGRKSSRAIQKQGHFVQVGNTNITEFRYRYRDASEAHVFYR